MYITKTIYDNRAKSEIKKYADANNLTVEYVVNKLYSLLPSTIKESDDLNKLEKVYQSLKLLRGEEADKLSRVHLFDDYWVVDTTLLKHIDNLPYMCVIHDVDTNLKLPEIYTSDVAKSGKYLGWYSATQHHIIGTVAPSKQRLKILPGVRTSGRGDDVMDCLVYDKGVNGFELSAAFYISRYSNRERLEELVVKITDSIAKLIEDNGIFYSEEAGN